jgi:hypothetical protein
VAEPEQLRKATKKLKKIVTERKSLQRIEAFAQRIKVLEEARNNKDLSEMFRGHYISANPDCHKHRDHDPLLPGYIALKQ